MEKYPKMNIIFSALVIMTGLLMISPLIKWILAKIIFAFSD